MRTVSDENGRSVFPALPIGQYTIAATLQGFETTQITDNLVETDKTTAVDFNMKIGQLTDTVQVLGETPIVDPFTVAQTTRLTRDEFDKLPVGRSDLNLIGAAPGVVGTGNVNSAGALTSSNRSSTSAASSRVSRSSATHRCSMSPTASTTTARRSTGSSIARASRTTWPATGS